MTTKQNVHYGAARESRVGAGMTAIYSDLSGTSVFISGGGSGIGAAMTDAFLAHGALVAFVQRSDATDFVRAMKEKHGRAPLYIPCDITDKAAMDKAFERAATTHGAIAVLINNAADDTRVKTLEVTEEFWDQSLSVNLKAYFFAAQAVIPGMQANGGGSIINLSSISYMMGNPGYPTYATANAGITGMSRVLAREFGPDRIRVNALLPGWVMTKKQRDLWATEDAISAHLDRQCLKQTLSPEDIVGGALFLASTASKMMTGQALVIDGGVAATG